MRQDILENRLNQLSKEDHQLILLKLKELISNTSTADTAEKPKRLVAYIESNDSYDSKDLEAFLKKRLPDYMVPSAIYNTPNIALLPNGKIDRKNLKPIKKDNNSSESILINTEKSLTKVETQLIKIWEDVLNFSPVLPEDNFFEIGGDSILSIQIIAKAKKLGIELTANQLFEHQTICELSKFITLKEENNSTEHQLIKIWEDVLNTKPILTNDNFFEIGGDSILSIQIIAKARKLGIEFSANQLFEHQTIDELLPFITSKVYKTNKSENLVTGKVEMTPIQDWFFDTHKNAPEFWNQGFKFTGIPDISKAYFENIALELIIQHDSLRSSFKKNKGNLSRYLLDINEIKPADFFNISDISDADLYIKAQVNSIQKNFELSKANLFKCIYFKAAEPKDSIIIFIAHHLLVDAVSWQIIINDFRALINDHGTDNKSLLDKSTSLNKWGEYLNEYANSDKLKQEIDFWANQINEKPNLPVDLDFDKPILENSIEILHFTLDKNKTSELLKKANKEFKTKIDELLVGALTLTLSEWSKADIINLGMERHGRETQDIPELDLSNSVGWFTSYFPVKLQLETQDLSSHIKSIKEQLRQIPNKGIGYGVLKYKSSDIEIDGIANYSPEVLFNYLGVNHQIKDTEDLMVATAIEDIPLRSNKSERDYLFEINTFVQNDILHINWSYSKDVHHPKTISNLTTSFKTKLEKIINHCLNNNDETYTPSDFPDVDLNQDDLNNLLDSL